MGDIHRPIGDAMEVKEKVEEVVAEAVKVHENFEGEIDPWLKRWLESPVSGWIACGFGVALLVIGFVLGKVF